MAIDYGNTGGLYLDVRQGDALELTVTGWTKEQSKFTDSTGAPREDLVLEVEADGEAKRWRLNAGARRACREAGVDVGHRIRVKRDEDTVVNGRTQSNWEIEVLGGGDDDLPY
jgi:hypothetical protein